MPTSPRLAITASILLSVSLNSGANANTPMSSSGEHPPAQSLYYASSTNLDAHEQHPALPPPPNSTENVAQVPEPAGYALLALGIIGLGLARHRSS